MKNGWSDVRWSPEHLSESEEPPDRGQTCPELQNLPETEELSTSQANVGHNLCGSLGEGTRRPEFVRELLKARVGYTSCSCASHA